MPFTITRQPHTLLQRFLFPSPFSFPVFFLDTCSFHSLPRQPPYSFIICPSPSSHRQEQDSRPSVPAVPLHAFLSIRPGAFLLHPFFRLLFPSSQPNPLLFLHLSFFFPSSAAAARPSGTPFTLQRTINHPPITWLITPPVRPRDTLCAPDAADKGQFLRWTQRAEAPPLPFQYSRYFAGDAE